MLAINFDTTHMSCGECGIEFFVPNWFYSERKATGKGWYCPNGHPRIFRETDAQKLRRELEGERKRREWAEHNRDAAQRSRSAILGQMAKLRKRIGHGVCPCCKRSFQNLKRHISNKHPEFKE